MGSEDLSMILMVDICNFTPWGLLVCWSVVQSRSEIAERVALSYPRLVPLFD
jgi:hypothetical protein